MILYRLEWKLLNSKKVDFIEKMPKWYMGQKNWKKIRDATAAGGDRAVVPYLPFLVNECAELNSTEDDFLSSGRGDIINMVKRYHQLALLQSLRRMQAFPEAAYRFEGSPLIQQYLCVDCVVNEYM